MRKTLALVLLPLAAVAAGGPLVFDITNQLSLTDCASSGATNGTTPKAGNYYVSVTDADTSICFGAATCPDGGVKVPLGTSFITAAPDNNGTGYPVSCRSPASTGDVQLTKIAPN